jgi:hypothetical protein
MGSATPTPLAMVRNRPSNEPVISAPFGTSRMPLVESTSPSRIMPTVRLLTVTLRDSRRPPVATGALIIASMMA